MTSWVNLVFFKGGGGSHLVSYQSKVCTLHGNYIPLELSKWPGTLLPFLQFVFLLLKHNGLTPSTLYIINYI